LGDWRKIMRELQNMWQLGTNKWLLNKEAEEHDKKSGLYVNKYIN
jgi:hypothetical protein